MRVAMLLPELRLRGGIRRSLLLAAALAEQGHDLALCCPGGPLLPWLTGSDSRELRPMPALQRTGNRGPKVEQPRQTSIRRVRPAFAFEMIPWTPKRPGGAASWAEARRFVKKIEAFKPDVIHVGSLVWPLPWWEVVSTIETATRVATIHGTKDVEKIPRRKLVVFDTLIAVSRTVQEALINDAGQPIARVRHVSAGAPVRHRLGGGAKPVSGDQPVVACVDSLTDSGGVLNLLRACKLLRDSGSAVMVLIVGEGRASSDLRRWLRETDAHEWVVLAETVYDADGVIAAADAMVACGGTLDSAQFAVEAMGLGIPALLSGIEGNFELVVDGESGILYPPDDPTALANRLGAVLSDKGLRDRLADGGAARVAKLFSLDAMVSQTLQAYDRGWSAAQSGRLRAVGTTHRLSATTTRMGQKSASRRMAED